MNDGHTYKHALEVTDEDLEAFRRETSRHPLVDEFTVWVDAPALLRVSMDRRDGSVVVERIDDVSGCPEQGDSEDG